MGGHPACDLPATLHTKYSDIETVRFYCHRHRVNRHVWEGETLIAMPATAQMRDALVAALDAQIEATNTAANHTFEWMQKVEVAIRSPYKNYWPKTVAECARVRGELDEHLKNLRGDEPPK